MIKNFISTLAGITVISLAGTGIYADRAGLYQKDDEAAKKLVDKYVAFTMKNYEADCGKISFHGIVKEGCDFWYFNDYNSKQIAKNHCKGSRYEVTETSYSIDYDSVKYQNNNYMIDAVVTSELKYKNYPSQVTKTSHHTFMIEQKGSLMYIVDDRASDYDYIDSFDVPCEDNNHEADVVR